MQFSTNRRLLSTAVPVASGTCSSGFMRVNKDTPCGKILSSISSASVCFHYGRTPVVHYEATEVFIKKTSSSFDLTENVPDESNLNTNMIIMQG